MKNTIAIIGAGRVGSTVAYSLLLKNLVSELLIIDINRERSEGEVRDLADTLAFSETANIKNADFADARNADIIVITAGHAQKPGQTRLELFKNNKKIITDIIKQLEPINPKTVILIVTNPMDLLTLVAQQASSLPQNQIFGSGTWLDTQRLRRYLSKELNIAPESIDAYVIGEHGNSQCVAWSQISIGGAPIKKLGISAEKLITIEENTKKEAYIIIEKKHATYYGIAACVIDICEAIIFDQKRIMPLSTYVPELEVCLSIPVVIGSKGIERNAVMHLNEKETTCLKKSAEKLKSLFS